MAKGGSQKVEQESTFKPSPQQQEIINLALPFLRDFATNPPDAPDGTSIAGFNPTQLNAQRQLLRARTGVANQGNAAAASNAFLMSPDILDPDTNPGLRGAIDAATRPIIDQAMTQLLPATRGDMVLSGQYSGTKRGQMEGDIVGRTMQAVGDTAANITSRNYADNLNAMTRGVALSPQVMQGLLQPGMITGGVGDIRHALTQARTSEQYQQDMMADVWPLILGQEIMGSSMMIPGGTNVSSGTQSGGGSTFGSILGGLSSAASILPSLFAFL